MEGLASSRSELEEQHTADLKADRRRLEAENIMVRTISARFKGHMQIVLPQQLPYLTLCFLEAMQNMQLLCIFEAQVESAFSAATCALVCSAVRNSTTLHVLLSQPDRIQKAPFLI